MTPLELKVLLLKNGITHVQIADTVGLSPGFVGQVIRMEKRSLRVERVVATLLDLSVESVFGEPKRARRGCGHPLNVQNLG